VNKSNARTSSFSPTLEQPRFPQESVIIVEQGMFPKSAPISTAKLDAIARRKQIARAKSAKTRYGGLTLLK